MKISLISSSITEIVINSCYHESIWRVCSIQFTTDKKLTSLNCWLCSRDTSFRFDFYFHITAFYYLIFYSLSVSTRYKEFDEIVQHLHSVIDFTSVKTIFIFWWMKISIVTYQIITYQFHTSIIYLKLETLNETKVKAICYLFPCFSTRVICAWIDTEQLFNLLKIICRRNDGKSERYDTRRDEIYEARRRGNTGSTPDRWENGMRGHLLVSE